MVANATLDTVYKTLTHKKVNTNFYPNANPSIEIKGSGGTVNIYLSNEENAPADAAAMTLLQDSPFAEGIYNLNNACKWILFEQAAGTSVIKTNNCIKT